MEAVDRARKYIEKMEPAVSGSGGHDRTYAVACVLTHGFGFDSETVKMLLSEWNESHCKPKWSEGEIVHKIKSAMVAASTRPRGYLHGSDIKCKRVELLGVKSTPKWPVKDSQKILSLITNDLCTLRDLELLSPIHPNQLTDPVGITDMLFLRGKNKNPWLCVAIDIRKPATRRRAVMERQLELAQFIVPNPMLGPFGKTKDGRKSVRCLGNTGRRCFLVIECDFTEKDAPLLTGGIKALGHSVGDLCATVLAHLAKYAPLVMAVNSGGKSIHGWFAVMDRSEDQLRQFMRYACTLGADKATWSRCQFVRMPNGVRGTGELQKVHYFSSGVARDNGLIMKKNYD